MRAYVLLPDGSTRLVEVCDPPPGALAFRLEEPVPIRPVSGPPSPERPLIVCCLAEIREDTVGFATAHYRSR